MSSIVDLQVSLRNTGRKASNEIEDLANNLTKNRYKWAKTYLKLLDLKKSKIKNKIHQNERLLKPLKIKFQKKFQMQWKFGKVYKNC